MNGGFAPEPAIQQLISFLLFVYQPRLTPFYAFPYQSRNQLSGMARENFDVHVIWSPQIRRRQTWMDHRRLEGRRGRSANHP
jgi:hypothetical protein